MHDANIFLKRPISFKQLCTIYPPSVQEILDLEGLFPIYKKILTSSQEDIEDNILSKMDKLGDYTTDVQFPSPMENLFKLCHKEKEIYQLTKAAFKFFLKEDVMFLFDRKEIMIGNVLSLDDINKTKLLKEEDFFLFQNAIRACLGEQELEAPRPNEDVRIRRIKAKGRLRERIKAKQGKGISLTTSLVSLCCMGLGITPLNIGELAYGAIGPLINTYQAKEKYETDIASLLAGADSKKVNPQYWIRN